MRTYSEKEIKYYTEEWAVKRLNKWSYVFKNGFLYQGLPVGVICYFLAILRFHFDQFKLIDFCINMLVYGIGGMLMAYWTYSSIEKNYRQACEQQAVRQL